MLTLWGRTNSINVQKVFWCLEEVGAPYRRIDAGRQFGVVRTPDYLAMNPNALVPTLDDDGFILWESNAIVRYLCAKFPERGLIPQDLKQRADADRWMDWQQTTFNAALGPAFTNIYRRPPEERNDALIRASLDETAATSRTLETRLADRPYVAGEAFTMGDIPIAATAHRWLNMGFDLPDRPNIRAYYQRIMQRPAARTVLVTPIS